MAPHYFLAILVGVHFGLYWALCFLFLSFHILHRSVFLSSIFLLSSSNRDIIMTSSSSSLYGCWRAKFLFLMSLSPVHSNRKCLKSSFSPWHTLKNEKVKWKNEQKPKTPPKQCFRFLASLFCFWIIAIVIAMDLITDGSSNSEKKWSKKRKIYSVFV